MIIVEIINEENMNKRYPKKGILSKLNHVTFDSKNDVSPIKIEENANLLKNIILQKIHLN